MSRNIFITGASGFIGQHVLQEFSGKDFFIYALSRKSSRSEIKNVRFLKGDLLTIEEFSEQLSSTDYFIHIAGEKKNEGKMDEINVKGLAKILFITSAYPKIRFLLVSSTGIYGIKSHPETILTENTIPYPTNMYERSKYEAEKILIEEASKTGIRYSIIRPSNIFGENDNGLKLLNLLKIIKRGLFFFINPNAVIASDCS